MIAQVDICNLALTHLGVKTISSMTEPSVAGQKCNLFFEPARNTALRAHDWNFARRIDALATLANETYLGWPYVYQVPANCLALREIRIQTSIPPEFGGRCFPGSGLDLFTNGPLRFEEFLSSQSTKAVACQVSPAYARYTQIIEDTTLFDPLFDEALSYKLAAMLAKPLTGDNELASAMQNVYAAMVSEAQRANKTEGTERLPRVSSFESVR